jgi:ATP-binding cassette subfamily F protein 3
MAVLLTCDSIAKTFGSRTVFTDISLSLHDGERLGVIGPNGAGKSTFLQVLSGNMKPDAGTVSTRKGVRLAMVVQDPVFPPDATVREIILAAAAESHDDDTDTEVSKIVSRVGFEDASATAGTLSGGWRKRLAIAAALAQKPDVLLLDEPTNHLDIESREALIQALNDYEGAVILVTHDPHLIELVSDRLWLVGDHKVTPYDGDLDDYRKLLLERRRNAKRDGKEERKAMSAAQREAARRSAADMRASLAPLRKTIATTEQEMAKIAGEIAKLDTRLADPELYVGPAAKVTEIQTARGAAATRLAAAEQKWLEATAQLEAAGPDTEAA